MTVVMQSNFDVQFQKKKQDLAFLDSPPLTRKPLGCTSSNTATKVVEDHVDQFQNTFEHSPVDKKTTATNALNVILDCGTSSARKEQISMISDKGAGYVQLYRERLTYGNEHLDNISSDWIAPESSHDLVANGLYITLAEDDNRCTWCGGYDNHLEDHSKVFPKCPYASVKHNEFAVVSRRASNRKRTGKLSKRKQTQRQNRDVVRAVVDLGIFKEEEVENAAKSLLRNGGQITSDSIIDFLAENCSDYLTSDLESIEASPHTNSLTQISNLNCEREI